MAIVSFGTIVTGVRGTIGGATFSASQSGPNVRIWSRGSNPRSRTQSNQRGRVSMMPELWRALSSAQQAAWAAWAALPAQALQNSLGQTYFASGYAWFVKINTLLLRAGFSPRTAPPTNARPAAPVITAFNFQDVASVFVCDVTYNIAEFPAGVGIVIFGASVPRGGRLVQYPGYRMLINSIASPTGTYDFSIEWADAFGVPQVGDRGFIKVYKQDDQGLRGAVAALQSDYS